MSLVLSKVMDESSIPTVQKARDSGRCCGLLWREVGGGRLFITDGFLDIWGLSSSKLWKRWARPWTGADTGLFARTGSEVLVMSLGQLPLLSWWAGTICICFPRFGEVTVWYNNNEIRNWDWNLGRSQPCWSCGYCLEGMLTTVPCRNYAALGMDGHECMGEPKNTCILHCSAWTSVCVE
jgi:hypothetical protein